MCRLIEKSEWNEALCEELESLEYQISVICKLLESQDYKRCFVCKKLRHLSKFGENTAKYQVAGAKGRNFRCKQCEGAK